MVHFLLMSHCVVVIFYLVLQTIALVETAALGQVVKYRVDAGVWTMVGITAFGAVLAGRRLYHPCKPHKSDIVVILGMLLLIYSIHLAKVATGGS